MMRRAATLFLDQVLARSNQAGFASQVYIQAQSQDYGLVLKKAAELTVPDHAEVAPGEIGACAGVPAETFDRPARIFVRTRSSSQQGFGNTLHQSSQGPQWRIEFDTTGKWENPLMGWTSSADTLENVGRAALFFYEKEEAIAFCEKHGWKYEIDAPRSRRDHRSKRYSQYGDNYSTKRKGIPDVSHMGTYAANQKK